MLLLETSCEMPQGFPVVWERTAGWELRVTGGGRGMGGGEKRVVGGNSRRVGSGRNKGKLCNNA